MKVILDKNVLLILLVLDKENIKYFIKLKKFILNGVHVVRKSRRGSNFGADKGIRNLNFNIGKVKIRLLFLMEFVDFN